MVFQPHLICRQSKGTDVGYFQAKAFAAGAVQICGADFFDNMSVVDKSVVGGQAGQFIQDMAGDQKGDLPFFVQF